MSQEGFGNEPEHYTKIPESSLPIHSFVSERQASRKRSSLDKHDETASYVTMTICSQGRKIIFERTRRENEHLDTTYLPLGQPEI